MHEALHSNAMQAMEGNMPTPDWQVHEAVHSNAVQALAGDTPTGRY